MYVTKPYEFIGFGAMDVTKPYEFIGFGAMDVTKPYESLGHFVYHFVGHPTFSHWFCGGRGRFGPRASAYKAYIKFIQYKAYITPLPEPGTLESLKGFPGHHYFGLLCRRRLYLTHYYAFPPRDARLILLLIGVSAYEASRASCYNEQAIIKIYEAFESPCRGFVGPRTAWIFYGAL